jgi:hypothetical protein
VCVCAWVCVYVYVYIKIDVLQCIHAEERMHITTTERMTAVRVYVFLQLSIVQSVLQRLCTFELII